MSGNISEVVQDSYYKIKLITRSERRGHRLSTERHPILSITSLMITRRRNTTCLSIQ